MIGGSKLEKYSRRCRNYGTLPGERENGTGTKAGKAKGYQ